MLFIMLSLNIYMYIYKINIIFLMKNLLATARGKIKNKSINKY